MKLIAIAVVSIVFCFSLVGGSIAAAEPVVPATTYLLGVFPFVPVASIEGIFAPLAAELSKALGKPVKLRSASSFDKFTDDVKNRVFDIAFVQPFDYVDSAKPGGYLPLAARNDMLASHIVVKQDSPVKSLADLKGKSLGMPPKAAAVSFLNRLALKKAGLTPDSDVKMVYLGSHQACLQQLMIGMVAACGVSPAGIRLAEAQLKTSFRLVHESPEIPSPLFVVRKELPPQEREAILKVLLTTRLAGVKPEFRAMFVDTEDNPFRKVTDKEYDIVRNYMKTYGAR